MVDIFLSYSRADRDRVAPLAEALADRGWSLWWDQHIPPGRAFDEEIEQALEGSRAVVTVWTENSAASRWVRNEASVGAERNVLVPIRMTDVRIPIAFRRIQAADLTDWQPGREHTGFAQLITALEELIGRDPTDESDDPRHDVATRPPLKTDASEDEIHSQLKHYKRMIAHDPTDADAHYQVGLCYLHLRLYDLAIRAFERTIDLDPEAADAYYYLAVSLIRGRRPKLLSLSETKRIQELIDAASVLSPQEGKFLVLAAIVNFDYYVGNGLSVPTPSYESLLASAESKNIDSWEIERLLTFVPVVNEDLQQRVRY